MHGTESGSDQPGGIPRPERGDGRSGDEMSSAGVPSDVAGVEFADEPERQWHADVQPKVVQQSDEPYAGAPVRPAQVDVTGQPVSRVQGSQWHETPQAYVGRPSRPSSEGVSGLSTSQPSSPWHENGPQQGSVDGSAAQQIPLGDGSYGGVAQHGGYGQPGVPGRPGGQGLSDSHGQAGTSPQAAPPGLAGEQAQQVQYAQQGQPLRETQRVPRGDFVVPDAQYTNSSVGAVSQHAGAYGGTAGGQGRNEARKPGRRGVMTPLNIALGIAVLIALGMTIGFIGLFAAKNASESKGAASASGETSSVGEAVTPSEDNSIKVPRDAKECKRFTGGAFDAVGTLNASTSCEFAVNVHAAYVEAGLSGDGTVKAFSPATKKDYEMSCTGSAPVTCTGGVAAKVILYKGSLNKQ